MNNEWLTIEINPPPTSRVIAVRKSTLCGCVYDVLDSIQTADEMILECILQNSSWTHYRVID